MTLPQPLLEWIAWWISITEKSSCTCAVPAVHITNFSVYFLYFIFCISLGCNFLIGVRYYSLHKRSKDQKKQIENLTKIIKERKSERKRERKRERERERERETLVDMKRQAAHIFLNTFASVAASLNTPPRKMQRNQDGSQYKALPPEYTPEYMNF